MKLSIEFDWKEVLALAGALLLGLGAGVVGSNLLRQADELQADQSPVEIRSDYYKQLR